MFTNSARIKVGISLLSPILWILEIFLAINCGQLRPALIRCMPLNQIALPIVLRLRHLVTRDNVVFHHQIIWSQFLSRIERNFVRSRVITVRLFHFLIDRICSLGHRLWSLVGT
jgi:hypothetical protein